MASTYIDIEGKAHWAKIRDVNVNEYRGKKTYQIDMELSDEELGKVKGAGLDRLKVRELGDGKGVRFSRPYSKDFRDGKGEQPLGEPNLSTWDEVRKEFVPFTGIIGNGSKVRANLKIYEYKDPKTGKPAKGHQLMGVTVIDLVEYKKPDQEAVEKYEEEKEEDAKPW